MKRLLNYLPIHLCICLIFGICLQYNYQIWSFGFLYLAVLTVVFLCLLIVLKNKFWRTISIFCLFFTLGISSVYVKNSNNYKTDYKKHVHKDSSTILQINKILKPGNYYYKYEASVYQVDSLKTRGGILLNIEKDSLDFKINVDDLLFLKTEFKELIPPLNPHQFDYKSYLKKKGITQQLFINSQDFKKLENNRNSLFGFASKFRTKVQNSLKKHKFSSNELGVINALLLGQRQEISKELLTDYSRAGAIHILAISGLHVGIILLILTWLLKPLEFFKNGKFLKTILIIVFLWAFAFIAGLSASVVRAVTMFTFVAFGLFFQRKNVVEFSLISSLFFLLIVNPMFLFDVGFQLSYLAVFGIIWVQPKLYNYYKPKLKVIDFFWRLFTVSIAAQFGILPLSIYYFHQFPGLFLLSNLLIIPFLGVVLFGGIAIILLSVNDLLPLFLVKVYGYIISLMNNFVKWISHQESFLLKDISLSFSLMLFSYFLLFSIALVIFKISYKKIVVFLISIICFQSLVLFEYQNNDSKKQFIVFHKSRNSIVGNREGTKTTIYHDLDTFSVKKLSLLQSFKINEEQRLLYKFSFPKLLKANTESILIVDSLGIYQLKYLKNPIVVLQFSPKINLERLIQHLQPKQIIADGSNYKSSILIWEKTSKKYKTPFHYTGQKGAYIVNY